MAEAQKARKSDEELVAAVAKAGLLASAQAIVAATILAAGKRVSLDAAQKTDIALAALRVHQLAVAVEETDFWLKHLGEFPQAELEQMSGKKLLSTLQALFATCGMEARKMLREEGERARTLCAVLMGGGDGSAKAEGSEER